MCGTLYVIYAHESRYDCRAEVYGEAKRTEETLAVLAHASATMDNKVCVDGRPETDKLSESRRSSTLICKAHLRKAREAKGKFHQTPNLVSRLKVKSEAVGTALSSLTISAIICATSPANTELAARHARIASIAS
jgi:hypothetical protein